MLTRRNLQLGAASYSAASFLRASWGAALLPEGACDSHVHVIGDPVRFPMDPDRGYTPPEANAADLRAILDALHLSRVVIVTPTVYGHDVSATLDAIATLGRARARGTVTLSLETPQPQLEELAAAGIVGLRVFLPPDPGSRVKAVAKLRQAGRVAGPLGWHLEIATPPEVVDTLRHELARCPAPVVLDTFGWLGGGTNQRGFAAISSLLVSGRVYVKLSEPYRLRSNPSDYAGLKPLVHALVNANPGQIVWGSGWPHVGSPVDGARPTHFVPNVHVSTRHMLDLLRIWDLDARTRERILVRNPAKVFGFDI
jgi:predicted TIM-barrel fold metal-dependent hydrolase